MRAPRGKAANEPLPESDRHPHAPHPRGHAALFGQEAAERALLDAYRSGRLAHAWILGGRPGIGKATLAWRFARFLTAHPDHRSRAVEEARDLSVPDDSAAARTIASLAAPNIALLRREWNAKGAPPKHFSVIRVEDVREASQRFRLSAVADGWRIAIIDTADDLNPAAANALLKLIEEPPARSLFLLVSHQPGRLLPTIRSRCRRLMLSPLGEHDVNRALQAIGTEVGSGVIARARGSVGDAVSLSGADGGARIGSDVERLLRRLPDIDWREVTALADRVAPPRAEAEFEGFLGAVFHHLQDQVRARAPEGPQRLAPLAQVWEQFDAAARATDLLNLDKRALVLSLFEDLSAASASANR